MIDYQCQVLALNLWHNDLRAWYSANNPTKFDKIGPLFFRGQKSKIYLAHKRELKKTKT